MNSKNIGSTANGGHISFSLLSGDSVFVYLRGRTKLFVVRKEKIRYGKSLLVEKYDKLFEVSKIMMTD